MDQIALLASDASHMPLLTVFRESGVSRKYGFDIDLHLVGDALAPTMKHRSRLMLAGEIEFLSGLHHETYRQRASGEKRLIYLAQAQNNWDDRLLVSSNISQVTDLAGKRITCHATAPCVRGNLFAVLASCGIPADDINIVAIEDKSGSYQPYVEGVLSGEADATLVDMPFDLYGQEKGLRVMELPDRPVIHNTTLLTSTDYAKDHEDVVINFIKSFIEAVHFFKTRPEEVTAMLKANLTARYGLEDEAYYAHLQKEWARILSVKPYPLPAAIQNVYDLDVAHDPKMQKIGAMEPWDLHYLRAVDDSGFIDELYGR